jgi:hypothetical protein
MEWVNGESGRPPLPVLFDFAIDAMDEILGEAQAAGYISGVVPHLISGGVSYLQ